MEERGLLLLFISDYKKNASVSKYKVRREGSEPLWFEGAQTNDAPVKYLLSKGLEDGNKIEKIICIVSQKVEKEGYEEFKSMVNGYIREKEVLNAAYGKQEPEYHKIEYPEDEAEISDRAAQVYRQIAAEDCIGGENRAKVYIDYTGGLRDINFLMTAIIRYLGYHGVTCKEIVYSSFNRDDKEKNEIYSLSCIYDMYQLLNGVEQFVNTGNADLLSACYCREDDSSTRDLLKQIVSFSHAMSLCDVRDVDGIMDRLCAGLDQFDAGEAKGSFFSVMFGDLTSLIRKKLYIEKDGMYSYPRLIRWCLDNNMVQQALTLYIEKMPEYYCSQGLLKFSEEVQKDKKNQGQTWRTEFFYGPFYDQFVMWDLKCFVGRLRDGHRAMQDVYPLIDQFTAKEFGKLKDYMNTPEEKKAVDRLVDFLKKHYGGVRRDIIYPYTGKRAEGAAKTANGFIKTVITDKKWQIYFFYNSKKRYGESNLGTYERKVLVLDEVKAYKGRIPMAGTDDNNLLYNCMKYYLALKIIRNRINHASEQEAREDERRAVERLEKSHGISMDIEFENVKSLILQGIDRKR